MAPSPVSFGVEMSMASVVIRVPNWLGDAVMATAAIARYRELHPDEEISLLGIPQTLAVYENSPYSYHLIDYDRAGRHNGFRGMIRLAWYLRELHFEKSYLLTNSFSSALIFSLSDVPHRIGYARQLRNWLLTERVPWQRGFVHQVDRYVNLFNSGNLNGLKPRLFVTPEESRQAQEWLEKRGVKRSRIIGLAVGAAYGPAKRWPAERFGKLARRCEKELDASVLLLGSKSEFEMAEEARSEAGPQTFNIAGETNLRMLFAILQKCQAMVSNDSGLMHAATALDVPTAAIFGPTEARETAPYSGTFRIIKKNIPCAPCYKRECPLVHHDCMKMITVDDVVTELQELLEDRVEPVRIVL